VIDLGMVTTPMVYFAAATLARSGIQVTASHNPKQYNGFKLVLAGRAIHGEEIQALRRRMEAPAWDEPAAPGSVRKADVFPAYLDRIASGIRLARPLKIVLDCGNGVAGAFAPQVFRALGCEVIELFSEVDGNFPNHHPDPGQPENLQDLIAAVAHAGADLGLALDGDGDRLGVVTRGGQIIYPDRQLMLFAQDVLARIPGAPILFDVKSTQRLAPAISAAGGQPVMCKSGYVAAEGQDAGAGCAAGRRDERPHLLQRALVRLRRRHLRRLPPAGDPLAPSRSRRGARSAAGQLLHAGAERALRGGRAARGGRRAGEEGQLPGSAGVHHRWIARGLAGRLRPGARLQHHADAHPALRGPYARGDAAHRGGDAGAAAYREARR
jgi:hypothetical protein